MNQKKPVKKLIIITDDLNNIIYENMKIRMILGKRTKVPNFNEYIRELINEDWENNKQKLVKIGEQNG